MNIIKKITNNFKKTKECFFCKSKLEPNKKKVIFFLEYNPRYCYNCNIDYCESQDNNGLNLRIIIDNFMFAINGEDICVYFNNEYIKFLNEEESDDIISAKTKQDLYFCFNKIIKELIKIKVFS